MASRPSLDELEAGILEGDRASLSRAITLAESARDDDRELAQDLISRILPKTGEARRVGLTGVPGAGKSTMIESLGTWLIEQGKSIAVLVVDPSSSRTGGSILGDKTRMQELSASDQAFIRPSPSSGMLGGVARRTRETVLLCEAAGFDLVLVESVGVGQSEAELAELVDCLCLLLVPGAGDELQGIKRGIMELCDLVVVNKADGENMKPARRAAADFRHALKMLPASTPGWETKVLTASATERTGLEEFWNAIEEHRAFLESSNLLEDRRSRQRRRWLDAMLEEAVLASFRSRDGVDDAIADAHGKVDRQEVTVPQAVSRIMAAAGLTS